MLVAANYHETDVPELATARKVYPLFIIGRENTTLSHELAAWGALLRSSVGLGSDV